MNHNHHHHDNSTSSTPISTVAHRHDHVADHHGHASSQMAASFLRRFKIVGVLLLPLFIVSMPGMSLLQYQDFLLRPYLELIVSTLIFGFGLIFFEHAKHELKAKQPGMMTLVSIAVGSGYLFSVASTFIKTLEVEFHLEIASLIWILLFGHYLEAKAGMGAGNALEAVSKLLPTIAHRHKGNDIEDVPVNVLTIGDEVLVKPGEKIPADGIIISGQALVNEAHISGESTPIRRGAGQKVVAGAIVEDSNLKVKITAVGDNSTVGQIKNLIATAQSTKPSGQRLADRAARILTIAAVGIALGTVAVWLSLGESIAFALTLAITVLVIACPHALGLAIPTVSTIATEKAAKNGIFIKDLSKLEIVKDLDYVIFDKTGTLTEGKFGVTDIVPFINSPEELLTIAASIEQYSSHSLAQAIVALAKNKKQTTVTIDHIQNHAGKGMSGLYQNEVIAVGNRRLMEELATFTPKINEAEKLLVKTGRTIIFVAKGPTIIGILGLSDVVRARAKKAIEKLHQLGIKVAMITGDNKGVAENVARNLNIDTFFAEVLPEDKYKFVKKLQNQGNIVAMVGDGVNDAPALTQANVGIAIGAGTDVAVEAGDIILAQNDPAAIPGLIALGKSFYRKITQNLWWALGYNIIAIPAAAGVFVPVGFTLSPQIGAVAMALSSVIVVLNAQTLRRLSLKSV